MQMPSGASLLPATETLLFLIWMAGADLDSERQVVVLKVVGSNPTARPKPPSYKDPKRKVNGLGFFRYQPKFGSKKCNLKLLFTYNGGDIADDKNNSQGKREMVPRM